MAAKYDLQKTKPGTEFYWNLKAGNGEVILTSETYKAKQGALDGIASCKVNSALESQYENKGSHFVLKAANHEVIGKSETYSSDSAMQTGIASVATNGPTAATEDNT